MVAVNIQVYQFVFAEALLLVVLGYWIYFKDSYAIDSTMSAYFYKIFLSSVVTGGLELMMISTIRYWYWDGVYSELAY